jgi:hypothetical protein
MSHMVYSDHIAITSGDKSTTRSKVSAKSYPVALLTWITLRDPTDTHRRNGRIRKSHLRSLQLLCSAASMPRHLVRSRWYMAAASSNSLLASAMTAAETSATD